MEKEKRKLSITPEQMDKAANAMSGGADKVVNAVDNVRGKIGLRGGNALMFGVVMTLIVAIIHSPWLGVLLLIFALIAGAEWINSKAKDLKKLAEEKKAEKDRKDPEVKS